MSVMSRLKAIRERLSAQNAEEAAAAAAHVPEMEEFEPPAPERRNAVNMWDLVENPADEYDDDPELSAALDMSVVPFAPPKSAAPAPAPEPEPEIAPAPEPDFPAYAPAAAAPEPVAEAPAPAAAPARISGRVKTRLLSHEYGSGQSRDVFDGRGAGSAVAEGPTFPLGWVVVIDGPGRGASFPLLAGVSQIGRDEDQAVQLDFGDTAISRSNHAALAFDDEQRAFFIGHGGKSNIVRVNGRPLLSTEPLKNGDHIRIGETTLRLVALCGDNFSWADQADTPSTTNG